MPGLPGRRLGRRPVLVALGLVMIAALPGGAVAQVTLQGTVNAPSTGNELTIEVSNVSTEAPVEGLHVALAARPRYLTNVSIIPERVPTVMPGQVVEFTIRFDVRPDAPAGRTETLALQVTAERGATIDFPRPRLAVTFAKPAPPATASAPGSAPPPGGPQVLRLVKISMGDGRRFLGVPTDSTVYEYREGQSGFVARHGGTVASVRVLRAPAEISLDRPFEVEVEARWRGNLPPDHRCENPATRNQPLAASRASVGVWLGPRSDAELAASSRGPEDMRVFCRTTDEYYREAWTPPKRPAAAVDGLARVTLQVIPARVEQTGRATVFHFRGAASSTHGTLSRATLNPVPLLEWDPSTPPAGLNVNFGALGGRVLFLRYEGGAGAASGIAALPPYEHPGDMRQPPRGEAVATASAGTGPARGGAAGTGQADASGPHEAGARPGAPGGPVAGLPPTSPSPGAPPGAATAPRPGDPTASGATPGASGPATSSLGPGSSGTQGTPGAAGSTGLLPGSSRGPVDPSRLDPSTPEIAGLISQWLGVAEPPDNARGARLRYDEWGRMVGTGIHREQITAGARPDAAGGMPSTAYVWTLRDSLDSVNHCRLGEYVLSMLQGDAIARCQGRYAAPPLRIVASLAGLPAEEAEARVRAQGLVPDLIGGDPPPSREREYTVQAQDPPAGSQVREGERVTLKIHAGYVEPRRAVPELRGLDAAEAERRLRELGLRAELTGGDPPPSREREYTVQAQNPQAGSQLREGERVALKIHAGYVEPRRAVPDLRGLGAAVAERRLRELGLRAELTGGDPPPSRASEYTVQAQDPPPGSRLAEGERVALRIHSGYVEPERPRVVAPQPPAGGSGSGPRSRPAQEPSRGEPEICATYYSNLPDLGRSGDSRMALLAAKSAVAAGCDPGRVQQAVSGGLAPAQPASPPPSPPVSSQPQALPAWPSERPWPAQPPAAPPRSGGGGEPAACANYYETLTELARADEGPNGAVARMTAQSALSAGCSPQRIQQALAAGAASPYSRRAAPPPPPPQPQVVPPRAGGAPPTGEPGICEAYYANMAQWSRRQPAGSNHQAVQNEARKALSAGCNRQRVEQILVQGRPPAPSHPPARPGAVPPRGPAVPLPPDRCPGGGYAILGQC